MGLSDETRRTLVREYGFWRHALEYQERAGFRCEYCDADLLANVDVYHGLWARDHIIPKKAGGPTRSRISLSPAASATRSKGTGIPVRIHRSLTMRGGMRWWRRLAATSVNAGQNSGRNREDLERELAEVHALIRREMEPGDSRHLP